MSNSFEDKLDILEKIDYRKVIKEISNQVNQTGLFIDSENIIKNIPEISYRVAKSLNTQNFKNVINVDTNRTVSSTLNMINEDENSKSINELYRQIESSLSECNVEPIELKFLHNNKHYERRKDKICAGIEYQFKELEGFISQMDYSNTNNLSSNLLREDIVEYSYSNKCMSDDIEKSLISFYTKNIEDENEKDRIINILKNRENLVNKVVSFITTLRCGYLKRATEGFIYMEFVLDILKESQENFNNEEKLTFKEFSNYVKRFNLLENLVLNALFIDKNLFTVEYDGISIDFLHKLRTDNVYSFLPIVGILEDPTSTVRDSSRENGIEMYGISLKRNGVVAKENLRSFNYNMQLLKSIVNSKDLPHDDNILHLDHDKKYKLGNEILRALLLEFFLVNLDDDSYDPSELLKSRMLSYKNELTLGNRRKIINSIENISSEINKNLNKITNSLNNIVKLISKYINEDCNNHTRTITKKLSVLNMILPKDLNNLCSADLYSADINPSTTHLVKYTVLMDEALPEKHCVYSYEYKITLKSLSVFKGNTNKKVKMAYNLDNFKQLSIGFLPKNSSNQELTFFTNKVKDRLSKEMQAILNRKYNSVNQNYENSSLFFIEYADFNFNNSKIQYIYDLSFTILSTIISNILSEKAANRIFELRNSGRENKENISISNKLLYVNLMQFTYQEKGSKKDLFNENQTTVRELRKSLAFSLSIKHTATSQGFNMREIYNTSNALASMYSKIPRVCELPNPLSRIEKLAIITVTSSCVDRAFLGKNRSEKMLLLGDVVTIKALGNKRVVNVSNYKTFEAYVDKNELHNSPNILRDIVTELSSRGYKDILYLAKTPYTSKILEQEDKSEMYFMNESVLSEMAKGGDVSIYPLYINYTKVQHDNNMNENENTFIYTSLFCESLNNSYNNLEGIIPLIKIFTSSSAHFDEYQTINKDNYYSKSIMYSSIKGIYSNEISSIINNKELLINKEMQSDIKNILVMLHAVRNAKIPNLKNTLSIKGNPYDELIGDESISKLSNHTYYLNGDSSSSKKFTTNRLGLVNYITKVHNNK